MIFCFVCLGGRGGDRRHPHRPLQPEDLHRLPGLQARRPGQPQEYQEIRPSNFL